MIHISDETPFDKMISRGVPPATVSLVREVVQFEVREGVNRLRKELKDAIDVHENACLHRTVPDTNRIICSARPDIARLDELSRAIYDVIPETPVSEGATIRTMDRHTVRGIEEVGSFLVSTPTIRARIKEMCLLGFIDSADVRIEADGSYARGTAYWKNPTPKNRTSRICQRCHELLPPDAFVGQNPLCKGCQEKTNAERVKKDRMTRLKLELKKLESELEGT